MQPQTRLKQYMTEELLIGQDDINLQENDNLLLSGLIDSLGVMRLISFIEEEFHIQVHPEDVTIENFNSINVIANYVERTKSL